MKISKDFILREIADEYILVPTGKTALSFNGLVTINETGAIIWNMLLEEKNMDDIVNKIVDEYEVEKEVALKDAMEFIEYLRRNNIVE